MIESGDIGMFAEFDNDTNNGNESMIEKMRQKNDAFYNYDHEEQSLKANEKPKKVDKRKHHAPRHGFLDSFLES
jgi:hypothetical protein